MNIVVHIPDEFAQRLTQAGTGIERRALEALMLEEFRAGRLSAPELRRALGFATRPELDAFLKAHAIYETRTLADLDREQQVLDRLGI